MRHPDHRFEWTRAEFEAWGARVAEEHGYTVRFEPLGVVSNSTSSSRILSWQLAEFGLLPFFEFVMSSADYVVRKPHPAIFLAAARKLEMAPGQIWFVGDSPEHDVAGAASAGMVSVLYRPTPGPQVDPSPDIEVASWRVFYEAVAAV